MISFNADFDTSLLLTSLLGSGAGIDVFLAANIVKDSGKAIGIDMTDAMLQKARKNATDGGYTNVESEREISKRESS